MGSLAPLSAVVAATSLSIPAGVDEQARQLNRLAASWPMTVVMSVLFLALCVTVYLHILRDAAHETPSTARRLTWIALLVVILLFVVLSATWQLPPLRWIAGIALGASWVWLLATVIREQIGRTADAVARATNRERRREEAELEVPIETRRARGAALERVLDDALDESDTEGQSHTDAQ